MDGENIFDYVHAKVISHTLHFRLHLTRNPKYTLNIVPELFWLIRLAVFNCTNHSYSLEVDQQ